MRVVVVGDLAWDGRYHLGDEAMSEVVLQQLQSRGDTVTFIAGNPEVTTRFYGVAAVPRFGMRDLDRDAQFALLDTLEVAAGEPGRESDSVRATFDALRTAAAVIIAGGGNLNSIGIHHVLERVAVTRIARALDIPLYVTSQTVGPHLRDGERELVAEIAQYARVFGVRERNSAALVRGLAPGANVVHTLDDAILLEPAPLTQPLDLPARYAVASFTFHPKTTALHVDDYYRELAAILDQLATELDIDVLLLPHMSTFQTPNTLGGEDDGYGHARVAALSASGRLRVLPLVPAAELLTITTGAEFSVSTRYHPLIFGAALGVPAIGIVTSYYSAIRMRGALANVGMESFAIPFEHWRASFAAPLIASLRARLGEFREHLGRTGSTSREFQQRWWAELVASLHENRVPRFADVPAAEDLSWADSETQVALALARGAQELTNLDRLNALMDTELRRQQHDAACARIEHLERELGRLGDAVGDLRHRLRPPGANLRDALRRRLASGRGENS